MAAILYLLKVIDWMLGKMWASM